MQKHHQDKYDKVPEDLLRSFDVLKKCKKLIRLLSARDVVYQRTKTNSERAIRLTPC